MRYFLFSWRWALNCCSSCPCPRMAFGCSGQSHIQCHAVFGWSGQGCMRWVWRWQVQMDAAVKQMDSWISFGSCMPRGWVMVTGSHGGLAAKLEDERESFLALVSKTRTKLLKAFPLHEVPKLQKCILLNAAALAWHRRCQMFAGPGDSLGHFDGNQLDRLRCSPRPSHCHRVAAANARR